MRKNCIYALLICSVVLVLGYNVNVAQTDEGEEHIWNFDSQTIEKGYTVSSPDENFNVGILPTVLKGNTAVTIKVFDHVNYYQREIYQVNASALEIGEDEEMDPTSRLIMDWALPEGKQIISPIYEFDIKGAADLYNPSKPLWLRVHYSYPTLENKNVYYWHKGEQQWVMIPTNLDKQSKSLKAAIHLTYAPIAILADVIPSQGEASWYSYQHCNCAASRFYPAGTLLLVTDLTSKKEVIVEVNDYGPEEWTGRLIDLDLVAFEQLTEKWKGVTQVKVEPYLLSIDEFEQGLPESFIEPSV